MTKRIAFLIAAPFLLLALIGLFLVEEHVRGRISLNNYRKELAAKGEVLTVADLATGIAPEANGAEMLLDASKKLPEHTAASITPRCMKLTDSGTALAGFRKEEWIEDNTNENWISISNILQQSSTALQGALEALQKPQFDNQLDYEAGPKLQLPHLSAYKGLSQEFGASVQLALHQASTAKAAENLIAQVELTRAMDNDRLLISELVRIAVSAIGRNYTWEALLADGWQDEDLAKLAAAWERPEFVGSMARALDGERVYVDGAFRMMRKSNSEAVSALYWMEDFGFTFGKGVEVSRHWWDDFELFEQAFKSLRNQVYIRIWRFAWLDQHEERYMRQLQSLGKLARDAERHKNLAELQSEIDKLQEQTRPKSMYDRVRAPGQDWLLSSAGCFPRVMKMETDRQMVLSAIALKRYALRHGRYPESLQALVSEFLKTMPVDYMDGQPLRYRLNPDGSYLLYSVGENHIDDGGNTSPMPEKANHFWNRLDTVWPAEEREASE